jgi:hypothetical protein
MKSKTRALGPKGINSNTIPVWAAKSNIPRFCLICNNEIKRRSNSHGLHKNHPYIYMGEVVKLTEQESIYYTLLS